MIGSLLLKGRMGRRGGETAATERLGEEVTGSEMLVATKMVTHDGVADVFWKLNSKRKHKIVQ